MISVIVCTYNRDKYLYKALSHIASNDYPANDYEIVLVNNNSTDNTLAETERFKLVYPNINITIVTELQNGLSFARNRGIAESKGDFLVFLDDDTLLYKAGGSEVESVYNKLSLKEATQATTGYTMIGVPFCEVGGDALTFGTLFTDEITQGLVGGYGQEDSDTVQIWGGGKYTTYYFSAADWSEEMGDGEVDEYKNNKWLDEDGEQRLHDYVRCPQDKRLEKGCEMRHPRRGLVEEEHQHGARRVRRS